MTNDEYLRDPKTAVIEGLGDALSTIMFNRSENGLQNLDLSDGERKLMEDAVTHYVLSRFNLRFKE